MSPRSTPSQPIALTAIGLQILLSLAAGPRHGYGIKLDIEERTDGAISPGSGTLYQALQRLEAQGLIEAEEPSVDAADARRGREYGLLPPGRDALESELRLMRRTLSWAESLDAAAGAADR